MEERVITFGQQRNVGVLTLPTGTTVADNPAVILLNSGIIHRVGPNRIYVSIARMLAKQGFYCLRFDLSGIGDSPNRRDKTPFPDCVKSEVREAMDYLQSHCGVARFVLSGICSGAQFSLQSAVHDQRVCGVAAINNPAFAEVETDTLNKAMRRHFLRIMFRSSYTSKNWLKVVTLRFDVRRVLSSLVGGVTGIVRGLFRKTPRGNKANPPPNPSAAKEKLSALVNRGIPLLLVHSEGDEGLDILQVTLGDEIARLVDEGGVSVEILPRSNHTFTLTSNQTALLAIIGKWFGEQFGSHCQGEPWGESSHNSAVIGELATEQPR